MEEYISTIIDTCVRIMIENPKMFECADVAIKRFNNDSKVSLDQVEKLSSYYIRNYVGLPFICKTVLEGSEKISNVGGADFKYELEKLNITYILSQYANRFMIGKEREDWINLLKKEGL
tara:strand:+ start:468 stop:824 length:357 start_codon:yes stop_codon:yes gene_type:complete